MTNKKNKEYSTPLMLAVEKGNAFEVATLLAEGADPTIQDEFGITAKQKAEEKGLLEIAALLEQSEDTITDYDQTIITSKDDDITIPEIHLEQKPNSSLPVKNEIENKDYDADHLTKVIVTDIKIPFISMIGIMLKWILATTIASSLIASFVYLVLFIITKYT